MNITGVMISIFIIVGLHIALKRIDTILIDNELLKEKFGVVSSGVLEKGEETPFKLDTAMPFNVTSQQFNQYQDFNTINVNELDDMKGELMSYIEDSSNMFEPISDFNKNKVLNENIATFKDVPQIKPETIISQDSSGIIVDRKDTVPLSSNYGVQYDKQFKQKLYLTEPASNTSYRTFKRDNWVHDNEKPNNGGFIDGNLMAYDKDSESFAAL